MHDDPTPRPARLRADAAFDRPLAADGSRQLRFLCVTLRATREAAAPAARPPLDLALVLDASGSMQGRTIDAVRLAATGIVDRLDAGDSLAVVAFASEAVTALPGTRMDDAGRAAARAVVERLHAGGQTALYDGWLAGADLTMRSPDTARCQRHVILLSDGMANVGETRPGTLVRAANAALSATQTVTSCVGVGDDYETAQLMALAEGGGGRFHHASAPDEIIEVVLGELDDVRTTACVDTVVEIALPEGVEFELPEADRVERLASGRLRVAVGALLSDLPRDVVIPLMVVAPPTAVVLDADVTVQWNDAESGSACECVPVRAALRVAVAPDEAGRVADQAVGVAAARCWYDVVVQRAIAWNRGGDGNGALAYLDANLSAFRDYVGLVPGAAPMLAELERLRLQIARPMAEGTRKEWSTAAYKMARAERDKRAFLATLEASWSCTRCRLVVTLHTARVPSDTHGGPCPSDSHGRHHWGRHR